MVLFTSNTLIKLIVLLTLIFVYLQPVKSANPTNPAKPIRKFNQVVIVNSTDFVVIQLKPKDNYQYVGLASNGLVYQTTWVFSHYDYTPTKGLKINPNEYLTDKKSRFVYKPNQYTPWSQLDLLVWSNSNTPSIIQVHVLPESKQIVSSRFLLGDEAWIITGSNPLRPAQITHWGYNGGFITGTENYIHVQSTGGPDKAIWYFKAPEKYYRDLTIGYSGTLEFELVKLGGDFSHGKLNPVPIVKLSCPGLTLNYYSAREWTELMEFKRNWTIRLVPEEFSPRVTPKDFASLLEQVNSIEILGDWTSGYETIGLNWVQIKIL